MRKSWNNPHGVRLSLGIRNSLPLEGLIVQPSELSQREIGSIMRDGKKRMRENYDTMALQQAFSDIERHLNRSDHKGIRL